MKVDLQNPNPGRFFPWPGETEEEKAGITVRLLNQQAIRSFDEETVSEGDLRVIDGQLLRERVVDEVLREELRLDYCIVNWTGLQDEDGKEIPCTRENKVKLMHNDPQLSGFLENCFNKLQVEQKMRIMGK